MNREKRLKLYQALWDETRLVEAVVRKPWTYIKVELTTGNGTIYGHGFSKVCFPDVFDELRGYELAYERAIRDAYKQLLTLDNAEEVISHFNLNEVSK